MKLSEFDITRSKEVIELFNDVFTHSEGESEGILIGGLVNDLINTTNKDDLLGFVVSVEQKIIGCVFFSRLIIPNHQTSYILSPMAIAQKYQGNGLGQKLIHYSLEQLKLQKVDLVFTYGDPKFYTKTGFKPVSENLIKAPFTLSYPEGWLVQSLDCCELDAIHGTIRCVSALNDQRYW